MPERPRLNQPLLPSVLDRLVDDDPGGATEAPKSQSQVLRELRESVRRDLENLLNTRWRCVGWPPSLKELDTSLASYGIPDFTGASLRAAEDADTLLGIIERAIRDFEPRLKHVRVLPLENARPIDRTLRFRIEAVLHVEPVEESVWFNSAVEPTTGDFQIEGEGR